MLLLRASMGPVSVSWKERGKQHRDGSGETWLTSHGDEEQHGGGRAFCTDGEKGAGCQTVINELL